MAGPQPRDEYQPFNASPQGIAETDSPRFGKFTVQANPEDFGGQVGQSLERLGKTGEQLGDQASALATHYAEQASQAHADDIIANQLVPATTKISSDYYQLHGKAAMDAYQPTLNALQQVQSDAIKDLPTYQQNLVRSFSVKHLTNLQDGMMRHQDQELQGYEKNSSDAFINAQGDLAVAAGSNPAVINQAVQSAVGRATLYAIHNEGIDPTDPKGRAILDERQRHIQGQITQRVVESAVLRGDLDFANNFYAANKNNMGGDQQLEVDKNLHAENLKSFGDRSSDALIHGNPVPHFGGDVNTTSVKANVAQTAQDMKADPNVALMISGLESSFGRTSENIGQTKGLPVTTPSDNYKNLVTKQIEATDTANKLFNGAATPSQIYTVYQQGVGGGTALLNPDNAGKKAVDVLASFYKNPQLALAAIQGNGGNATMTSSQFTDFLKQKCDQMYGQVACDSVPNIGTAINAPHQNEGSTVQPGATPVKSLQNFDSQYGGMLVSAQAIPNIDQRNATLQSLEEKHRVYQAAAQAWKTQFSGKIQDIVTDPTFTSMSDSRLTPDLRTAMSDDPAMLTMARNMARQNSEETGNKDSSKLGKEYWNTYKQISDGKITNISQLNPLADGTSLTREGLTQARKDLEEAGDYSARKKASFNQIETMITHGTTGALAKSKWDESLPSVLAAVKERESRQIPPAQYFDKDNKEWIGNDVKVLQMPKSQAIQGQINATKAAVNKPRTLDDIIAEAKANPDPAVQARLRQEAINLGFYNPNVKAPPQVPLVGGQ